MGFRLRAVSLHADSDRPISRVAEHLALAWASIGDGRTRIPMPLPRRCFSLMHGLIVMHHIVDDVPADALRNGLSLLGAAVVGPYTLPATQPQEAQP